MTKPNEKRINILIEKGVEYQEVHNIDCNFVYLKKIY